MRAGFGVFRDALNTPAFFAMLHDAAGAVTAIEIGDYFADTAGVVAVWWFATPPAAERRRATPFETPLSHRALSGWVDLLCRAGLTIEKFAEPCASAELAVADTRVAPLFLHVRARKPAAAA